MSNPLLEMAEEYENIAVMLSNYPSMLHRRAEYAKNAAALRAAAAVVEAAKGLSIGTDWNKGTHADIYRPQLLASLTAYEAACKEQP